ncbi:MAG: low molecular weight protein-tyrosine-phosphatase [Bacteroidales bacterium]|nr:low molecular weight protein-tyrosine-phosphatase [Bacteroidales bacterium]
MKRKVLFVCLGNICRSPAAEAVFNGIIKQKGETLLYEIDSAGTSNYHAGEPADARMNLHAKKRGYELTSISRPFNPNRDFDYFDIIVAMDDENLFNLKQMSRNKADTKKLYRMTDFSSSRKYSSVPDPYYGSSQGFELVIDILEEAGEGLYQHLNSTL